MKWLVFMPSDKLKKAIEDFEGCKLVAYQDTGGVWTIGTGHTTGVKRGMKITQKQADEFLGQDLSKASNYVNSLRICKTQGQFDALVDFAFNVGIKSLAHSTLLYYIKSGKPTKDIQAQFKRWVYDEHKKQGGLVKRRNWEAQRWAE